MNRSHRRAIREGQARAARTWKMAGALREMFGPDVTISRAGDGGAFCVMPIRDAGFRQWECGAIEAQGYWVGGSDRLRQAVGALMEVQE